MGHFITGFATLAAAAFVAGFAWQTGRRTGDETYDALSPKAKALFNEIRNKGCDAATSVRNCATSLTRKTSNGALASVN